MCDYSLMHAKSRPAAVEDKLTVKDFGHFTKGFAAPEAADTAVCVLPGTEVAFDKPISYFQPSRWDDNKYLEGAGEKTSEHSVARFRQVNVDNPFTHHDALELPGGEIVMLTHVHVGQTATVLQLPAAPKTAEEAKDQARLEVVA